MSSTKPSTNLFESAGKSELGRLTPASDTIETNFGTLEFVGGSFPTAASAKKIYDELDLQRATQAYMDFYPALSVYSIVKAQIRDFGFTTSSDIGVFADFIAVRTSSPGTTAPSTPLRRSTSSWMVRPWWRSAPGHDGQRQRWVLQVPHRLRPDRTRRGQGWRVSLRAARVHG